MCDVNCETELIYRYTFIVQSFGSGFLKNKRINKILPYLLVLVIPDILILHLRLLLYSYCENMEREIKIMLPLSNHSFQSERVALWNIIREGLKFNKIQNNQK